MKSDYLLRFINTAVNEFQKGKEYRDESFIIPTSLFEIAKPLIFIEIPYCELNEVKPKHFLKKFHKFISNSFRMVITQKTKTIRSLFSLKNKNDYKSCVIYKGDCFCGSRYIGETKHNAEVRRNEHNPTKSSEPSKHPRNNINHYFTWAVISNAPKNRPERTQKYHILLSRNLILTNKRTLKDQFYLKIGSHTAINNIMQTPKKEKHFFFFSVCCIVFNYSLQLMFYKKLKICVKRIHLVYDDGLYDRKAFYRVKIVFYSSFINDSEFINYFV